MAQNREPIARTFGKVQALAEQIMAERGDKGPGTTAEAISVAAAYQMACERHRCHHHPEESPDGVMFADHEQPFTNDALAAMQAAHAGVWQVIGRCHTENPGYCAAWDVWGVLVPPDEGVPSMQED